MAKSDIYMKEDRISVVGGDGREEVGGVERGDLEVTTKKEGTPDIRLNADWANLTLGGGTGRSSEGDVKLLDKGGNNRVTVTAVSNNDPDQNTRAWLDGDRGRLELGQNDEHDIHVPEIWLDGPNGEIGIADDPATPRDSVISLSAPDAKITVGESTDEGGRLSLLADEAGVEIDADVDDDQYHSVLRMDDGNGFGGIRLRTSNPDTIPGNPAGTVEVRDGDAGAGVELIGDAAALKVGYSYVGKESAPIQGKNFDATVPVGVGKSGRILLDDGDQGAIMGNDSTVFEVRAFEGKLQVTSTDQESATFTFEPDGRFDVTDDGGTSLLTVDPDDEVVEIPDGWHFKSGTDTVLE